MSGDIELNVPPGVSVDDALRQAFELVERRPGRMVILEYSTMSSAGKFLVTSESSYDKHMAAFDRALNHTGEFEKTYDHVVIGP